MHHTLKTLARVVSILPSSIECRPTSLLKFEQVPLDSRVHLTLVVSLWDARAIVKSIPTRATHQAVAQVLSTPRQPARVLGSPITPISVRLILLLSVLCDVSYHRVELGQYCSNSLAYAYDDSARFTCQASSNVDYTIISALSLVCTRLSLSCEDAVICFPFQGA